MRDHLEQVEKSTGKIPKELDDDVLSFDLHHIWNTYFELRQAQNNESAISFLELKAYCELTQTHLTGFELRCLQRLDLVFLRVANGRGSKLST